MEKITLKNQTVKELSKGISELTIVSPKYGIKRVLFDSDRYYDIYTYRWFVAWQPTLCGFYAVAHVYETDGRRTTLPFHRLILQCERAETIDHKNHDSLNNLKSNLRVCSDVENQQNKVKCRSLKTSIYKGVHWRKDRNRFRVYITVKGVSLYVGSFKCEHEAARAYNDAAIKHFGEYALLNQIHDLLPAKLTSI